MPKHKTNDIIKQQTRRDLITFLSQYDGKVLFKLQTPEAEELLKRYCVVFNKNFDLIIQMGTKERMQASQHFRNLKSEYCNKEIQTEVKIENAVTVKKTHTIKQTEIQTKEVHTVKTHEIVKQKISKIGFASDITVMTVKKIENRNDFINYYQKDYIYQLQGGNPKQPEIIGVDAKGENITRTRINFVHLELLKRAKEQMEEDLESNNGVIAAPSARIKELEITINFYKKLECDPIYFLSAIAEEGFNTQKELQGSILNDKAMIENANIVLEDEAKNENESDKDMIKIISGVL